MLPSTTVRPPRGVRLALRAGYPFAGVLLVLGLTLLLEWAAQATTFDGILGRGGYVGEPVALVVGAVLGLVLGLVWAGSVLGEALRAHVTSRSITLVWDDARVSVPRSLVAAVVLDADLVLVGAGTVELARVRCDLDRGDLLAALAAHGYPEPLPEDPNGARFAPWRRTDATLPRQERRLLAARGAALAEGGHGDAELLRRQLAARGVMVRDVHRPGRRSRVQEWRAVVPLTAAPAGAPATTGPGPGRAGRPAAATDSPDSDPHAAVMPTARAVPAVRSVATAGAAA
ncbi:YqeB family protein [Georgenia yuyongxinii]